MTECPWGWDEARLGCQHVGQTLLWSDPSMAGQGRAGVELEISAAAVLLVWELTALGWTERGSWAHGHFQL